MKKDMYNLGLDIGTSSIKAALVNAKNNKNIFSVIGDGAMTAGIAFEAMMHAGHLNNNLKIIPI